MNNESLIHLAAQYQAVRLRGKDQHIAECTARLEQALLEHASEIKRARSALREMERLHREVARMLPRVGYADGTRDVVHELVRVE